MIGDAPAARGSRRVTLLLSLVFALAYGGSILLAGGPRPAPAWWLWGSADPSVLVRLGATVPRYVREGEAWRLVNGAFLHAFLLHLALNLWVFTSVGSALEALLGSARAWLVFLAGAVAGGLAATAMAPDSLVPTVGASGGIFGVVGALGVWSVRARHPAAPAVRRMVVLFLLIGVALGFLPGVSNEGHAGGFLGGAVAMAAIGPRRSTRPAGRVTKGLAGVTALLALAALALGAARAGSVGAPEEVRAFLADVRAMERQAERLLDRPEHATPAAREGLQRRLEALAETPWLDGYEGADAFRAWLEAWRPVARGEVPDPFAFQRRLDLATRAWKPYERRLAGR
jgi:membrane associated rhomboid family serine protease